MFMTQGLSFKSLEAQGQMSQSRNSTGTGLDLAGPEDFLQQQRSFGTGRLKRRRKSAALQSWNGQFVSNFETLGSLGRFLSCCRAVALQGAFRISAVVLHACWALWVEFAWGLAVRA